MKVARNMGANENCGVTEMRAKLVRSIGNHTRVDGVEATDILGVELYRRSAPTACMSGQYEPKLIVFVQGKKRINVGKANYVCGESNFLLTSINLPVVSQVIAASLNEPILGLMLQLDMPLVREILSQQEFALHEESTDARGMAVGISSLELLDAPKDIPFLGGLIQREIIYRLLRSPQGKHLRAIATPGEPSQRTAKAVEWLRVNYAKPLRVAELATMARMGVSTLHRQFRSLTTMSLQFQKQLRLHVARERMRHDGMDAASAAFEVGYESASQFNREYSRFFGQPPMRDIRNLRAVVLFRPTSLGTNHNFTGRPQG